MLGEKFKWRSHENESTDGKHRGGSSSSGLNSVALKKNPAPGCEKRDVQTK
jgi:hypothetical protein